jgi:hypothetical protein
LEAREESCSKPESSRCGCLCGKYPSQNLEGVVLVANFGANSEREKEIKKRGRHASKERDRDRERESQWFWGRRIAALDSSRCGVLFFWEVAWPGKL